jgi:hypothetical protein
MTLAEGHSFRTSGRLLVNAMGNDAAGLLFPAFGSSINLVDRAVT